MSKAVAAKPVRAMVHDPGGNALPARCLCIAATSVNGKRYNRETLEIRFKGKSIAEVLDMTVEDGLAMFTNVPVVAASYRHSWMWA